MDGDSGFCCRSRMASRKMGAILFSMASVLASAVNASQFIYTDVDLQKMASSLASRLPMKIDSVTAISSAAYLQNRTLQYRYSINTDLFISNAADEKKMAVGQLRKMAIDQFGSETNWLHVAVENLFYPRVINENCTEPDMKKLLRDGVTLLHTFRDLNGRFFGEVKVSAWSCRSAWQ